MSVDPDLYRRVAELEERLAALAASIELPLRATGTFTPSFVGTTVAGTFTPVFQEGWYTRIGRQIFYLLRVSISAIGVAPTGNMTIAGLPFVSSASAPPAAATLALISQLDYPAGALVISARINQSSSALALAYSQDNATGVLYPAASFTNPNTSITASGFYVVD